MNIIVKKYSNSMRFFPHFNHSFGKFVHTKKDYLSEMKNRKLEPYDPNVKPKSKDYKLSKDAIDTVREIYSQKDKKGGFSPEGKLKEKLIKSGVIKSKAEVAKIEKKYHEILKKGKDGFLPETK